MAGVEPGGTSEQVQPLQAILFNFPRSVAGVCVCSYKFHQVDGGTTEEHEIPGKGKGVCFNEADKTAEETSPEIKYPLKYGTV